MVYKQRRGKQRRHLHTAFFSIRMVKTRTGRESMDRSPRGEDVPDRAAIKIEELRKQLELMKQRDAEGNKIIEQERIARQKAERYARELEEKSKGLVADTHHRKIDFEWLTERRYTKRMAKVDDDNGGLLAEIRLMRQEIGSMLDEVKRANDVRVEETDDINYVNNMTYLHNPIQKSYNTNRGYHGQPLGFNLNQGAIVSIPQQAPPQPPPLGSIVSVPQPLQQQQPRQDNDIRDILMSMAGESKRPGNLEGTVQELQKQVSKVVNNIQGPEMSSSSGTRETKEEQHVEPSAPTPPEKSTEAVEIQEEGTVALPKDLPFPQQLEKKKDDTMFQHFLGHMKKIHINLPPLKALQEMPDYVKFLKDIVTRKRKLGSFEAINLSKECSAIIQKRMPIKRQGPGNFTIACVIGVLEMEEDMNISLILGGPFLATGDILIDVRKREPTLRVDDEKVTFSIYKAMRHHDSDTYSKECNMVHSVPSICDSHVLASDSVDFSLQHSLYESNTCDVLCESVAERWKRVVIPEYHSHHPP